MNRLTPLKPALRARTRTLPQLNHTHNLGPLRTHTTAPDPNAPTPASYAYHIPSPAEGGPPPGQTIRPLNLPEEATRGTPTNLSPEQRRLLEQTIRVDHIGEAAANWIYQATKFVTDVKGDKATSKQVEEMWATEKHHLSTLLHLQSQHRVRPTILYPVWKAMAMGLGAGTALFGKRAIMACTEAVETVIGEHYDDQIKALEAILPASPSNPNPPTPDSSSPTGEPTITFSPDHTSSGVPSSFTTQPLPASSSGGNPAVHPSLPLLHSVLQEFRDDELEHLDTAVENEAQLTPGHALLSAVVGAGCRVAIGVAAKI